MVGPGSGAIQYLGCPAPDRGQIVVVLDDRAQAHVEVLRGDPVLAQLVQGARQLMVSATPGCFTSSSPRSLETTRLVLRAS